MSRLHVLTLPLSVLALVVASGCGDDGSTGSSGGSTGGNTSTGADGGPGGSSGGPVSSTGAVDSTGPGPGGTSTGAMTTGVDSTGGSSSGGSGGSGSDGGTTGGAVFMCSGMSFDMLTSVDNDLVTNLDVAGIVSCNQDITITATGGTVCATDDGAGGYYYVVETVTLEDVPPVTCGLAEVGLSNMSIELIGDGMEVVVPQAGGAMTGNESIQVFGDVEGTALGMPVAAPLMDFVGVLPEGDAAFGAGDTTFSYADTMTVVATAMPEPIPGVAVTVTLTGLTGSLTFAM